MQRGGRILLTLALLATLAALGAAHAVTKIAPDERAVRLVNELVEALKIQDPGARMQAIVPLVHKSMLSSDGRSLAPNVEQFSYRKAVGAASLYPVPVTITEVHQGNVTTIGFQQTAERGRTDKYFVAKTQGRPAPIAVFFPENGGEPKIVNFGSL